MKALRIGFSPVVIVFLLCLRVCNSQDFASDFEQAIQMLPKRPKQPASRVVYYDIVQALHSHTPGI
jgi:hypothetical protein